MYYVSTRDRLRKTTVSGAIAYGLAPDGGLYTPEAIPTLAGSALNTLKDMNYQQRALYLMNMYLDGYSAAELVGFCSRAYGGGKFDDPAVAPVRPVEEGTYALELWHGPTCAFKDLALQMLPHLLTAALRKEGENKTACILAATSGDTGKGALEGFRDVPGTRILVFYPKDGVSAVQEMQMNTQEGCNVGVCSVVGNFDDAQTGVKRIFSDPELKAELAGRGMFLSSANSINWGRVLPQIVYYVSAYCDLMKEGVLEKGDKLNVCVPTGNFGNILAAYYAKRMGVPFGKLICASNRNNVLTDFIRTGVYDRNRPFYNTISPSMDILISSNLERLLHALTNGDAAQVKGYMDSLAEHGRYEVSGGLRRNLERDFAAGFCDDGEAKKTIARVWNERKYLIDPHTAVAMNVLEQYRAETGDATPVLVASTASPFKFGPAVLEALGVPQPQQGLESIGQLAEFTGISAPAPLENLAGKRIRFDRTVEKDHMTDAIREMLL
ncbi:threonine synthase [Candidatus Pseudoscillospira sp. SGI.172]|uniref:threonine synthase n=1 Tax=Candidatus Pseudoscillospira sp. SGI.172 TaxID=3420582 RepID=UPI003D073121